MWNEFKSAFRLGAECAVGVTGIIAGLFIVAFSIALAIATATKLIELVQ